MARVGPQRQTKKRNNNKNNKELYFRKNVTFIQLRVTIHTITSRPSSKTFKTRPEKKCIFFYFSWSAVFLNALA
jgi:hypothetical protein